MSVLYTLSTSY